MNKLLFSSSSSSVGILICWLSLLIGCSDSSENPTASSGDTNTTTGGGGSATTERVGRFDLNVAPATAETEGSATFIGRVYAGVSPESISWETTVEGGDCEVVEPVLPFCDPNCGSSAACVADGECMDYPTLQDVGTVTVTGLLTANSEPVVVEPLTPTNAVYQPRANIGLMYPGADEGATVTLQAGGGSYAPFSIVATGIAPLEVLSEAPVLIDREMPLTLSWTPPADESLARILVELDISHHGGLKGQILCDAPDTGSLEVPAALVTKLIDLGFSGFPTVIVKRQASGSTQMELGRVDLIVVSTPALALPVEIPGLLSCLEDTDCPDDQTCQDDLKCG